MKNQSNSPIKIANVYANSIKNEIKLLSERINKHNENLDYGCTFHNLAAPCEMLVEYFGEKLNNLGFNKMVKSIKTIGEVARHFDSSLEEYDNLFNSSDYSNNELNKAMFRKNLNSFNEALQSLVPVLFFI